MTITPEKEQEQELQEDVLVVPKKLTKSAHNILSECNACPRPFHLEGRYGSRTHQVDEDHMGLPVVSQTIVLEKASTHFALKDLLQTPGVSMVRKAFVPPPAHRARDPPEIDARIHVERQRTVTSTTQLTLPPSSTSSSLSISSPNDEESNEEMEARFTYAELFAGIGGFGVALEALGGRCVFVSELEEHCRRLYQHNFPNTDPQNIHGDIYQVQDSDFPPPDDPGKKKPPLDLLVAGFPCQPFSSLGEQPGLKDQKGHLFQQIVRCLNISQPKAFLLENVPGLYQMKETYDIIVQALRDAGYTVTTEVVSARGLTATGRKRLYFVGFRNSSSNSSNSSSSNFEFPYIPDLKLRAGHLLDYDELPEEELKILRLDASTTFAQLLNNGRNWRPKSMAWPNRVCDTLVSHYGNSVGRGESQLVPCHAPHPPRRFSIRECGRLMGFPSRDFRLLPPRPGQGDMAYRKEYYRMFGNAVCPPVIAALAGAVLEQILPSPPPSDNKDNHVDWIQKGLNTAVRLAMAATRPKGPAKVPIGCKALAKTDNENLQRVSSNKTKKVTKKQKTGHGQKEKTKRWNERTITQDEQPVLSKK